MGIFSLAYSLDEVKKRLLFEYGITDPDNYIIIHDRKKDYFIIEKKKPGN